MRTQLIPSTAAIVIVQASLLTLGRPSIAAIIHVPGDFPTIQEAIVAAMDGDEVVVADGTWTGDDNRDLDFGGRLITVRSESGDPALCIIDCEGSFNDPHRGFHFHSGETSDAVVQGFTIRNGSALPDGFMGGRNGGAIYCDFDSDPTINNCTITGNSAFSGGGIMCGANSGSSPTITNCTITDNSAVRGGGIYSYRGSPAITNCIISGNTAVGDDLGFGGGIFCSTGSAPTITNCILWLDTPDEIYIYNNGNPAVNYSDVQGGWPGTGNIDADPLFVDPDNGNYRHSSGSPCIDAADNSAVPKGITTDLDGNPRFVDDPDTKDTGNGEPPIVDMGAYEFQGAPPCPWDLDGSGDVGITDLLELLAAWGTDPGGPPDFDGDGTVGITDLLELLANWGPCE